LADPSDLLSVARLLSDAVGSTPPSDAQLRRAVSTAYYALFHTILRAAAQRFMGPGNESAAGFSLLYRGFQHGQMRQVCEVLRARTLNSRFQKTLRVSAVSQDQRDFARAFTDLQDARQRADYDPAARFQPADASDFVDMAEVAMAAFDRIDAREKADVLALLLVGARS
jgi:uncharacterized protein (UPF0332 family)